MPWRRNKGEANPEPVLSKHERPEESFDEVEVPEPETPSVDVVVTPPVIIIDDDKKPKKDK